MSATCVFHSGINYAFGSVSELRDELIAGLKRAEPLGGPWVLVRRDDAEPVWGWILEFIQRRPDWLEAVGVALQHATTCGHKFAPRAFADVLEADGAATLLLPWTRPLAERFPDARPGHQGAGFTRDGKTTVPDILVAHANYLASMRRADRGAFLSLTPLKTEPLQTTDHLRKLLLKTAASPLFSTVLWSYGPWAWLSYEVVYRPWVSSKLPAVVHELVDGGQDSVIAATLDWLGDGWNPVAFEPMLAALMERPPNWFRNPITLRPSSWRYGIRHPHKHDASSWGDVAASLLRLSSATSKPVIDLEPFSRT